MERSVEQEEVKKLCIKIDAAAKELIGLGKLLVEEQDFFRMLTLRDVGQKTRLIWMQEIFDAKISDETLAFFCILLENQNLYHFGKVLAEGLELLGADRQGIKGTVYSAVPLEETAIKRLEQQTQELLKKPITLVNMIDESLLGGVLISADGKLIDASLKKRMEDLSLRLRSRPEGGALL